MPSRERAAAIATALDQVGPRLKRLRSRRQLTLTAVAESTGISKSTLSRLETGGRRPTLELLLALSHAYQVPLDDLVAAPEEGEPRAHDGYEWIYVLSGHMRFVLGDQDSVLGPGDVAAFDTTVPHWFGSTGTGQAEILGIFGRPGERTTLRAPLSRAAGSTTAAPATL